MRHLRTILAGTLLLALGACAPGSPLTKPAYYTVTYDPRGNVGFAQSRGGVPVKFYNLPFAKRRQQTEQVILATMARNVFVQPVNFFLEENKPEGFSSPYYVVMDFGQSINAGQERLCLERPAPSPGVPPSVTSGQSVGAAFCVNDKLLTSTAGNIDAPPTGPDDPRFVALIAQVTRDILPPVNPKRFQDGPDWSE